MSTVCVDVGMHIGTLCAQRPKRTPPPFLRTRPVTTFRTTSTAAVAVDEEDAAEARARRCSTSSPLSSSNSSECNEESGIHSLLLSVADMLHPEDQCIMVSQSSAAA